MKRLALILALALLALAAGAQDYQPLSLEEARAYIAQNPEAAAADIAKLDAIEHALPKLEAPKGILVVSGDRAGWTWTGPMKLRIEELEYEITLPTASAPLPRRPWWEAPAWIAGSIALGFIAGAITVASQ
jgi:hypothetical protein